MKKLGIIAIMISMVACSRQLEVGPQGPPGAPSPAPVTPAQPVVSVIDVLVVAENEYRVSVGQSPLTQGLSCTLYTVPSGTATIIGAALTSKGSYTYAGNFNSPDSGLSMGINVLPVSIRPLYTSWYALSCVGKLVVEESGYYSFELTSDDGSLLYLDGGLLVNNDGNHGATTVSAMKYMRVGVHDFTLKYMSGPGGNQALILKSSGVLVPAANLYH